MGELEHAKGRSYVLRADVATRGQRLRHGGGFVAKLGLSGSQRGLVDRPGEVGGQESFLHRLDFREPLLLRNPLFTLDVADVPERHLQRHAEPISQCVVGNSDRFQFRMDRIFQIISPPADAGVFRIRVVVRAAVVVVNPNAAAFQLSFDPFFAPCTEAERQAYMTADIFDRIREKIQVSAPYRSRMEAYGMIRVSFDQLWEMLVCDFRYHDEQDDVKDEDVGVDLVLILAADLCRLLIEVNSSRPVPESSQISGDRA